MNDKTFRAKAPVAMRRLMREFSITRDDAAAIMGNAGHESGGLRTMQEIKPTVAGSRGGYGWFQWTGPRRRQFEAWCKGQGLKPSSDAANIGFIVQELRTTEAQALTALRKASTLDAKVVAFERAFERAGVKHYDSRKRWARIAIEAFDASGDVNPKPLAKSRTLKGAATAGTGVIGASAAGYEAIRTSVSVVTDAKETAESAKELATGLDWSLVAAGLLALTVIGLAIVIYARWDDAGRPLPWGRT